MRGFLPFDDVGKGNYRLAYQSLLLEEKVPPKGADVV
jgi:hypothetical protein